MSGDASHTLPAPSADLTRAGRIARWFSSPVVQLLCRFGLAALFFYAAFPKLADPAEFARAIANYRLLPDALVAPLAVTLPFVEVLVALLLVLGFATRAAALVGTAMLTAFTAATAMAVARGLDVECGCFGKADASRVGWGTVARDVAFLAPAVVVLAFDRARYGITAVLRR